MAVLQAVVSIEKTELFKDMVALLGELSYEDKKIAKRVAELMNKHSTTKEYYVEE